MAWSVLSSKQIEYTMTMRSVWGSTYMVSLRRNGICTGVNDALLPLLMASKHLIQIKWI